MLKAMSNMENDKVIFLREVNIDDANLIAQWYNNKENIKFMSTIIRCKNHSKKEIEKELRNLDPNYERLFMICLKGKEQPIGHAGIDDIDFEDLRGEIFFLIGNQEEQSKGYGFKVAMCLLDYAFNKLKLNSLFASASVENVSSQKVLLKSGFKVIGIRREYNNFKGKFSDEIFYDLTKSDYFKQKLILN